MAKKFLDSKGLAAITEVYDKRYCPASILSSDNNWTRKQNFKSISVAEKITGAEIVEDMEGYSASAQIPNNGTNTPLYYGVCKNGNKITFVACGIITKTSSGGWRAMARFDVPAAINEKLVPFYRTRFDLRHVALFSAYDQDSPTSLETNIMFSKGSGDNPALYIALDMGPLVIDTPYFYRIECTYLLSDNLDAQ